MYKTAFPYFQYILLVLSIGSPLSRPYSQASPNGIKPNLPQNKEAQQILVHVDVQTPTNLKGNGVIHDK